MRTVVGTVIPGDGDTGSFSMVIEVKSSAPVTVPLLVMVPVKVTVLPKVVALGGLTEPLMAGAAAAGRARPRRATTATSTTVRKRWTQVPRPLAVPAPLRSPLLCPVIRLPLHEGLGVAAAPSVVSMR